MEKKIKRFIINIYNYFCLCLFKPSSAKHYFGRYRRCQDVDGKILKKLKIYQTNGYSFEGAIPLVCKQHNVQDAISILNAYFDFLNTFADHNENLFCGINLYFKFDKFADVALRNSLLTHEQSFDSWVMEKSDDRFDLHLLIKCSYYELIDKPLKSIRLLQKNLKREDTNIELALVKKHIEYANDFFDDVAIEYFLNDQIIDKCFYNFDSAGHEIISLYLTTLLRQDDLDKFFTIYKKIDLTLDLPHHTDTQRNFEFQLTEAYINSFQFSNARDLNGLFKYSINAEGYIRNWRTMGQTNFYLGNTIRSKAYFTLIVLFFGLNKIRSTDMKMLLGVTYKPINYLKQTVTKYARETFFSKTKKVVLNQTGQKTSIDNWSCNTAVSHLKSLFKSGNYQQASHHYERVILQLPGAPLRGTFLPRQMEGLKQNNVITYLKTFRQHITTTSLLRNIPHFEMTLSSEKGSDILVLAHFGPGDELIASSSYPNLIAWAKEHNMNISIATQQRLIPIMRRTFPEIVFIDNDRAIQGVLSQANTDPRLLKKDLPSTNLLSFTLNANTQKSLSQYDQISSTPLICSQFHKACSARKIEADPQLIKLWKERLNRINSQNNRLVGLSWRSSLITNNRRIYYSELSDLQVFEEFKNVTFINLQVKLTYWEKRFFRKRSIGFIDFSDLCLFNDFENVAALISNLDVTISPLTTMGELSAALHVPTILLSPTQDTVWRLDKNERDLIYGGNIKIALAADNLSCTEAAKEELVKILYR